MNIDIGSLETSAKQLACSHVVSKKTNSPNKSLTKLNDNYAFIASVYRELNEDVQKKRTVPPVAEWLLDNFYILEEQVKGIRAELSREVYKKLPVMRLGSLKGETRVYAIASQIVSYTGGQVDDATVISYLKAYQEQNTLLNVEIWSLSTMIRFVLIENIKYVCERIKNTRKEWRNADELTGVTAEQAENDAEKILQAIEAKTKSLAEISPSFIEHLMYGLRKVGRGYSKISAYLDKKLAGIGTSIEAITKKEHDAQAIDAVSMGNSIQSLKFISSLDWVDVFEETSLVEAVLSQDPARVYSLMDSISKNHYRKRVETLAKSTKLSEIQVAKRAVELAGSASGHIGDYLVKRERPAFAKFYSASIAAAAALIIFITALNTSSHIALAVIAALFMLMPAVDIAVSLINFLACKFVKPAFFPKLELKDGIPDDLRTFVVMPVLISSEKRVRELIERLERHYLANKEENLYFALVGDFKDSEEKETPADEKILNATIAGIAELNKKYQEGDMPVFYYFHRCRIWNGKQKRWMGWERKRGALMEFNDLLLGKDGTSFTVRSSDKLPRPFKYVITLDADTILPIDAAKRMIGTMAHPLNRPVIDKEKGIVTKGYGLIQPKVVFDVESANKSLFSRIFTGQEGIDPYACAISNVYQDLFGEGIFTGKGIYDLTVFSEVLRGAIPENTVLSHDLLEGCYIRVGLASDLELVDSYPSSLGPYASRLHRWVRGDWQIAPWLFKDTFSPISKWKILDNLRRSLMAPSIMILVLLGFCVLPGISLVWTLVAVLPLLFSFIAALFEEIFSSRSGTVKLRRHLPVVSGPEAAILQAVIQIALLPYNSYLMVNAVFVTLKRMIFTKSNMLDWVTAADAESAQKNTIPAFYKAMYKSIFIAALPIVLSLVFKPSAVPAAILMFVVWSLAPIMAYRLSKPDEAVVTLTPSQIEYLKSVGHKTWRYFEELASAKSHFLPPDNYQEDPPNGAAYRTSPTNIGLGLLCILAAKDLGYIGTQKMISMIENTITTIEKLQKWNGHLLNWYDTRTLKPLRPRYVSTVDSGNFVCYMMVLLEALKSESSPIATRVEKIIEDTSFAPLYDAKKQLFSIGYNIEENRLTNSYYDLLASEARQTSFLAIARREVPLKHWYRLGRALTMVDQYKGLVSWTGTMFEYLMPVLIMKTYKNTILDEAASFAVRSQKKYGRQRRVPWGASESGFYSLDAGLNYQYKAIGVPWLGLKRGLIEDVVVAPYATFLALAVDPQAAIKNLETLKSQGAEGRYGFFEAIDYTPGRVPFGLNSAFVRSYMAHHQGMSLLSIDNCINKNIMQERFHSNPVVKAAELLLQEKVPGNVMLTKESKEKVAPFKVAVYKDSGWRKRYTAPNATFPRAHMLSNGNYSVMITDKGTGFSKTNSIAVTRWREDSPQGKHGMFFYINNIEDNKVWSSTYAPYHTEPDKYEVIFSSDKARFRRLDGQIQTETDIIVTPADNAEIRKITLKNNGSASRTLELTSFFEAVASPQNADLAHPAFNNLFVKTEICAELGGIIAERRPRQSSDAHPWLLHKVVVDGEANPNLQFETDRAQFLGRGGSPEDPAAMEHGRPLSNSAGSVLDPIMSIRVRVKLEGGESAKVSFITAVANSRDACMEIMSKYQRHKYVETAFRLALTRSQVESKYLNLAPSEINTYEEMIPHLIFLSPQRRLFEENILKNEKPQSALWAYGISGDLPIIVVAINKSDDTDILLEALKAHEYLRNRGLRIDLVVLNQEENSYNRPLQLILGDLISGSYARDSLNRPGGVFIIDVSTIFPEDVALFYSAARIVLKGGNSSLAAQIKENVESKKLEMRQFTKQPKVYPEPPVKDLSHLLYFNGIGGFTPEGNEYVIHLKDNQTTPMPWSNVIANPDFGFVVSESGGGYTWYKNNRENKLTPWSNDPVSDPPGEVFFVCDNDTGEVFSPTPLPMREKEPYTITHGFGYSTFNHVSHGIEETLTQFVPIDEPVKLSILSLVNRESEPRSLSITYYVRPVIGVSPEATALHITSSISDDGRLMIQNRYSEAYSKCVVFVDTSNEKRSCTADGAEFFGEGDISGPRGVYTKELSGTIGAGLNPCAAMKTEINLKPGETKEVAFMLGVLDDKPLSWPTKYRNVGIAKKALSEVKAYWTKELGAIKVETPDMAFNIMMNGWLLYQTLVCRLWARGAFYQSGGAYGFRDQLQDALALVYTHPEITRNQILLHAAHQFPEGDVQHWWHPEKNAGIRTKFSDDLLWLPYAVIEYIKVTGDDAILNEETPFLECRVLEEYEDELYTVPTVSDTKAPLIDHCIRAIERSLNFGPHGLPLMGSGDWNDGMNTVGNKGCGESVWLGWFLYYILKGFAKISPSSNYSEVADKLADSIEKNAWDGNWYLRAYFDDGTPLGSIQNEECKIDLIAQSWAVISGAAPRERAAEAMNSAENYLIQRDEAIIKLLTPPFDQSDLEPGYIKSYVPGVRENGGQYTHAAAWAIIAFAMLCEKEKAMELFGMINPINHTRSHIEYSKYKVEPYVMPADVYAAYPHVGRGGWTWYTGSAGWMYRAGLMLSGARDLSPPPG